MPPRLAGPVQGWSGLEQPKGESPILAQARNLKFNAVWFSPLSEATAIEKQSRGRTVTGSYYAIRDHFRLDRDITSGDAEKDKAHLRHFCAEAKKNNMRVYADLVFNHIAADHPLVLEENSEINRIKKDAVSYGLIRGHKNKIIGLRYTDAGGQAHDVHLKFRRNNDLSLLVDGPKDDPWCDVAHINFASPEANRYFITGDKDHKALFKEVIDWHLDLGFTAFRCDAAYMLPPNAWQELISYTRQKQPDVIFMAETLGDRPDKVARMKQAKQPGVHGNERPSFDLGMLGTYWWNYVDTWLPQGEHPRVLSMAHFGGAGAPDNHDTEGTIAGNLRKAFNHESRSDDIIAAACVRDYAVAALACQSVFMQMGYEYCKEEQNSVFRDDVKPEDWARLVNERAGTKMDISDRLRAINQLKENLDVDNCRVTFRNISASDDGRVARLHCLYADADTQEPKANVVLLLNLQPEKGDAKVSAATLDRLKCHGLVPMAGVADGGTVRDVLVYHTPVTAVSAPVSAPVKKTAGFHPKR